MTEKYLNIVSFNNPYPPNYGGVIDVFYKLKALSENNVKIILHTFLYGREQSPELASFCEEVHYYKRKTGIGSQLTPLPYIVYSRRNDELLSNLKSNHYPILFEGLHTCFYLNHPELQAREKWVRIHNIEHLYYDGLAKNTPSLPLKMYFKAEAMRLKRYEQQLTHADKLFPLSTTERDYYEKKFGKEKVTYIPLFADTTAGKGEELPPVMEEPYVLYHGDLSSWENINAAQHLITNYAAADASIRWVFAGLNPDKSLYDLARNHPNVQIIGNLSPLEMNRWVHGAPVNLLYTNQVSGVKLKLLNALRLGQHCLATKEMVEGSGLEDLCILLPNQTGEAISLIKQCFKLKMSEEALSIRKNRINSLYNNAENAKKFPV